MAQFNSGDDLTALKLNEAFGLVSRKVSDETVNNSSTLQDDNELVWALQASTVYSFEVYVVYNSGATPDFKLGWTVPLSSSMRWTVVGYDVALALVSIGNSNSGTVGAFGGSGGDLLLTINGIITTSTTAGNLVTRWAQNTANASDTIVRNGSYGIFRKVV